MTDDKRTFLKEEEAVRLWKRAAELQSESARRAELSADEPPQAEPEDLSESEGYALAHVRAAALEAGIEDEFVEAALIEINSRNVLPARPSGRVDRLARWFLDADSDFVEASRVVDAPFDRIVQAMEKVCPAEPFNLSFKDRHGDLRSGGMLVFKIDGAGFVAKPGWVGETSWADLREIYVSIRPLGGDAAGCEVTLRSPVAWARGLNFAIGGTVSGVGGAAGLGLGALAAEGLGSLSAVLAGGPFGAVIATLVVVLGVLSGGGAFMFGFRALYDHGMRKGEGALTQLLAAISLEAQGGWGIPELSAPATDRPSLPSNTTSDHKPDETT